MDWRYSGGWVEGVSWKKVGGSWRVGGLNWSFEEIMFISSNKFYGYYFVIKVWWKIRLLDKRKVRN